MLPENHCGDDREGSLLPLYIYMYIYIYIYYADLTPARFEHSVCRISLKWALIYMYLSLINVSFIRNAFIYYISVKLVKIKLIES